MRFNGLTKGFFIFILALVTWAFFDVLSPYFSAILWAAILTTIFNPVKNRLRSALGERNGLASLITIVIICLIVFIPLMVILSSLAIELNVVYTKLQQNDTQFPEVVASVLSYLPDWARGFWQNTIWMMSRRSRKNCPMSCCRVDSTSPAARS
jgi:predicted PurR-regulated permease PerM